MEPWVNEMDYKLPPDELTKLWNAHRSTTDKRKADRIKAIYNLGTGSQPEQIAKMLMMDERTIRNYFNAYKQGGIEALLLLRYTGGASYLTETQKQELKRHLTENLYPTVKALQAYIQQQYNVCYGRSGLTNLLHELGFSYKKPKLIPGKANRQAQEEFIAKYENLRENADKSDVFLFMDATHPMHNCIASYGWIPKGTDKELQSNTGRRRLNINGCIDIKTMRWVIDMPDTVNAQSAIELFKKTKRAFPDAKKIYIICDNARYYRSKLVTDYLGGSKIQLVFLPPYSPNLNLIERFWKFFKKKVQNNQYHESFDEFVQAAKGFFRCRKKYNAELRTLLTENFQLFSV